MPVFLVRHAKAGDRAQWDGPDHLRPLSKAGRRQAKALAGTLAGRGAGRIVSSPSRRCVQSVEPVAGRLGLPVETHDALVEGASEEDVVGLARKLAAEDPVLCTHGDVIPTLLEALAGRDGLRLPGRYRCAKGSVWVLEYEDGDAGCRFTAATYIAAP